MATTIKIYRVVIDEDINNIDPKHYNDYLLDFAQAKRNDSNKYWGKDTPDSFPEWAKRQIWSAHRAGHCESFWANKTVATRFRNGVQRETVIDAWIEEGTIDWKKL